MTAPPPNSEWVGVLRRMHRRKRTAGVFGCLIGALMMLFGHFRPDFMPAWAVPVGLAIVALSWALFGWVLYDRWRWVKANPYQPDSQQDR
jgi:integral membrane sensor domain MASE1